MIDLTPTGQNLTRDLARAVLHRAGFSLERPSFRMQPADNGAVVVVLLDGAALEQRAALAADALADRFWVMRAGARMLVTPRAGSSGERAARSPGPAARRGVPARGSWRR